MVLIDSHGYSTQAGTHAVSLAVVICALLSTQKDDSDTVSCPACSTHCLALVLEWQTPFMIYITSCHRRLRTIHSPYQNSLGIMHEVT